MNSVEERAWDRAKRSANAVYASAPFTLASTCLLVVVASVFAYFSWGEEPGRVALGSMAAGLGAALFCFGMVLGFQVVIAPYRQRDELRRLVCRPEQEEGEIVARASSFARRGDDLLQACKASGGYTRQQANEVEQWTGEAADFLAPLGGSWAVEFSRASRGAGAMAAKLERRIEALDALVAELSEEDPVDSSVRAPA